MLITHPDGTVHFSLLKKIARSPAHYKHACSAENEPTRDMRIGTAIHQRVLGDRSDRPLDVFPGDRRAGKDWLAFKDAHATSEILTQPEWDESKAPALAVLADPVASQLLKGARTEVPLTWSDGGIPCSTGGIDVVGPGYLAELKSTNNAEPEFFKRTALRMLYHAQMAWYRGSPLGADAREMFIIAVETSAPYCVTVLKLAPDVIEAGEKCVRLWMDRLKVCAESNAWPGYAQSEVEWELPEWASGEVEIDT